MNEHRVGTSVGDVAVTISRPLTIADDQTGRSDGHPNGWPPRPADFGELLTPVEAAQYLRLDEIDNHTPKSVIRTLNYWREKGDLRATKYARRVWYRRTELDSFLVKKTED